MDLRLDPNLLAVALLGGDVGEAGVIAGQDHIESHEHALFSQPGDH